MVLTITLTELMQYRKPLTAEVKDKLQTKNYKP